MQRTLQRKIIDAHTPVDCRRDSRVACREAACNPTAPNMPKLRMTIETNTSRRLKPCIDVF